MKRIWIKLFIEILDDPKMGRLPDWLWRRAIELFLLAGENGNDGLLQPVIDMAWRLRTSEEKLTESLQALSRVGVVHETPEGWVVTHFKERQAALTNTERVQHFRERKRNEGETKSYTDDNETNVNDSISISTSDSVSSEEGESVREGEAPAQLFTESFGRFTSKRESARWGILFEAAGKARAGELIAWALRREIHLENRPGLMDSLETAARNWKEKSNGSKPLQEPKGFEASRRFLERHGVKNG